MKREKKTETASPTRHLDPESEKNIEEFAQLFIESMKEQYQNNLEPFEVYAQKLRSQLHSNVNEFRYRLAHGYDILLNEISHGNPKK